MMPENTPTPYVSVVTPTFNRQVQLRELYDSLRAQTCLAFEWIVCDDGSTDETEATVSKWHREAPFHITYFRQENQGKHIALNSACKHLRGEIVCEVDSDDALMPDAVEWIVSTWSAIPESTRDSLCGLVAQKVDKTTGKRIARPLEEEGMDVGFLDAYFRLRRKEENHKIIKTAVYRAFPFPETHPGSYFPECVGKWFPMSRSYKARWYNKVTYQHNFAGVSIQRQVGGAGAPRKQWDNMLLAGKMHLQNNMDYFWWSPTDFAIAAAQYAYYGCVKGNRMWTLVQGLHGLGQRLLLLAVWPIGYAVYLRRYLRKTIPS